MKSLTDAMANQRPAKPTADRRRRSDSARRRHGSLVAASLENFPGSGPRALPARRGPGIHSWVQAVRDANGGVPLKFAVSYSGFTPRPRISPGCEPKISTPTLHFLGGLDTVVEESRSQALIEPMREPGCGARIPVGISFPCLRNGPCRSLGSYAIASSKNP